MKRLFTTLLLLSSMFLLAPAPLQSSTNIPLIDQVERSIVKVETGDLDGQHGICTGFVVSASKGEVLTALHCVPEDEPLYVDGVPSTVVKRSETLALIEGPKMTKPPLSVKKGEAKVGEEIWSFGYAWGQLTVFHRWVAHFKDSDLATDGPLAPGMSGGPMTDLKGEVIGINQAANDVVGIACGSNEIRAFLKP